MSAPTQAVPAEILEIIARYFSDVEPTPQTWKAVAAEVVDDFRADMWTDPTYRGFLVAKLSIIFRDDEEMFRQLLTQHRQRIIDLKLAGHPVSERDDWLLHHLEHYRAHVTALRKLPCLEDKMLQLASQRSGENLALADTRTRSLALLDVAEDWTTVFVEGLPNRLIVYVLESFPELERRDPFWQRVQTHIGPGYSPEWLGSEEYCAVLNLQLQCFGFLAPHGAIRSQLSNVQSIIADSPRLSPDIRDALSIQLEAIQEYIRVQRTGGELSGPPGR